jgi:hypothetical protein
MLRTSVLTAIGRRPALGACFTAALAGVILSILVGSGVFAHPTRAVVGVNPSSDFQIMAWSLEWWPWAIGHGVNPLHTNLLWPPAGFSTLWMTTIPGPALLGLPVTLTAGPLVAYNVLILLAVPLASAAAYLLCLELTDHFAASLIGGLVFGLSPYMVGHTLSQHLDLTFVFPVPLLALLVVRYLRGRITARRFVLGFALLLLLQLSSSVELFVDLTLVVAFGVALALLGGGSRRPSFLRAGALIATAYGVCLPVLVPFGVLALGAAHASLRFVPSGFATDLLNLVVPTPTLLAGRLHAARAVSEHFVGNVGEQDGYLGIPLLIVMLLALRAEWRRGAWLVGGVSVAALLLSFGPELTANGRPLIGQPVTVARLPLLRGLLPARMSLFVALGAACLCALWFARPQHRVLRLGVGLLLVLSLLPNFAPKHQVVHAWAISDAFGWSSPRVPLGFTATPHWKRLIPAGSTVLVLPTGDRSAAGYWQVKSRMRFALAVPATPFAPPRIAAAPMIRALLNDQLPTLPAARLRAFLVADRIRALVLARRAEGKWHRAVAGATGAIPIALAGTRLYLVPPTIGPLIARTPPIRSRLPRGARTVVEAWLRFDGRRAHLRVRTRSGNRRTARITTLSSQTGDADMPAVATNALGRAAVIFTEWRNHKQLLRVATGAAGRWRVATLDKTTQTIWSPSVAVTPNGTTLATWIDETAPTRSVRAAALPRGGPWQQPVTLENGDGLGTVALGTGRGDLGVFAWHDGLASESRVRATTYRAGRWTPVVTVAETLARIDDVRLAGPEATLLRWRRVSLTGDNVERFEARRDGTRWVATLSH